MTVTADREVRVIVSNTGFSNPIEIDQYVDSATDLKVYADTAIMSLGVDYTVSGLMDDAGAAVTITATGLANFDPDDWVVVYEPPIEQSDDLSLGGRFGLPYERSLDSLARKLQSFNDKVRRTLRLPVNTPLDVEGGDLPTAAPNQIIGWDADGLTLENKGTVPQLETIAGIADAIVAVEAIAADVTEVAGHTAEIDALAALTAQIAALGAITTEISGVYTIRNNVTTVAGIAGDVTTVAGVAASVATVAGISAAVSTVAGISAAVSTVAGLSAAITTLNGISANITTVAGISGNVTTVAGIAANVTTVANNTANINAAVADLPSLAAKANKDGSNVAGADATAWRAALGISADDLPWLAVPVGGVVYLDTSLAGTVEPPTVSSLYRFAKLTAGLTGAGQYNNGVLSGESTTGSAPLVVSTATVALSGSPINGQTISLLNTEGRYLKPGTSPGTVNNDHAQEHYHVSVYELDGVTLSAGSNGLYSIMSRSGTLYNSVQTSGMQVARTGTSTDVKRRQVTAYMRVK